MKKYGSRLWAPIGVSRRDNGLLQCCVRPISVAAVFRRRSRHGRYSPNSTWLVTSRHVSTRLDTFDVSSESRRACRAVLFQHSGRRTSYSLYFSRFYAPTYTILLVPANKINN